MQKKLMAVAVAGALAMPGIAAAQSVSVNGFFKMGIENIKFSQPSQTGVNTPTNPSVNRTGQHDGELRITDNSSRIIFHVNEDLGSGLAAVAQVDFRFSPDNGALSASGNDWVGLKSPGMGMLTIGRWDVHYGKSPSDIAGKGALKAAAISIMDYIGSTPIANTTRTPNIIKWDSPNWSGFAITAAYSTNGSPASGTQSEADIPSTERKGSATVINPSFQAANFKVEYSNWNSKPDGSLADQKGDVINAWYKTGGLKIGGAWNKSSVKNAAGTVKSERTAMMIGGSFTTGPHEIHFHADRAGKVKVDGTDLDDSSAKMLALAYVYNLSKRTAMSVTYAKITNDPNINYHFFTDTGNGDTGLASTGSKVNNGEDPTLIAVILRHAF